MKFFHATLLTVCEPMVRGVNFCVGTEFLPPDQSLCISRMRSLRAGLMALALTCTLPRRLWCWKLAVLGVFTI
ncbi:hypothetical protein JF66_22595 [Cryobacterium sp. MLB-32]|nr:hypothetical protein JF66_22595 [Cryobacterium sp. MLB-32]